MATSRIQAVEWSPDARVVAEALAPAERCGSSWRLTAGSPSAPIVISAELSGGWLVLRSEPLAGAMQPEMLVALNARLPGSAKLAAFRDDGSIRAGAELPAGAVAITTEHIKQAASGVELACRLATAIGDPLDAGIVSARGDGGGLVDLPALVADAGFECVVRSPDHVAVDLGVADAFRQADLRAAAGGAVVATVTFDSPAPLPAASEAPEITPTSTRAAALLLLRASAWARMARGILTAGDGYQRAGFEVAFASTPSAAELGEALAALAAAARLCGHEIETLLADANVARLYVDQHQAITNQTTAGR